VVLKAVHELINTTGCINQLHFTGIERMRSIRDFDLDQGIFLSVFQYNGLLECAVERVRNVWPFDMSLKATSL
jgi:hypothetical protein